MSKNAKSQILATREIPGQAQERATMSQEHAVTARQGVARLRLMEIYTDVMRRPGLTLASAQQSNVHRRALSRPAQPAWSRGVTRDPQTSLAKSRTCTLAKHFECGGSDGQR